MKNSKKIIEVVAGVIFNKDNKVLIARRKSGKSMAGRWEFPGGKVKKEESHYNALQRELKEEFSINITVKNHLLSHSHDYGNFIVNLHSYLITEFTGHIQIKDHDKIVWVYTDRLKKYDITEADLPLIDLLKNN